MSLYLVAKKEKGRRYRYQQRAYRVEGKVKTESVYLGPHGVSDGNGTGPKAPDEVQLETEKPVKSVVTTEPTLRLHKAIRKREDISEPALIRNTAAVVARMRRHGLPIEI